MPGKQGFASMHKERLTEISRKGGTIAHQLGVAHRWSSEDARVAGRKGGTISRRGVTRRSKQDER